MNAIHVLNKVSSKKNNLRCELLSKETEQDWSAVLDTVSKYLVQFDLAQMDYQSKYCNGDESASFIVYVDSTPVAAMPLTFSKENDEYSISFYRMPLLPPVVSDDVSPKMLKKVFKTCLDVIRELQIELNIPQVLFQNLNMDQGLSLWFKCVAAKSKRMEYREELFIDLSLSLAEIRQYFRTRYKSLISKGMRIWNVDIVDDDEIVFKEFKELHKSVSGRATRSDDTWWAQFSMLKRKEAFLVTLRNDDNQLVGCGLFSKNKAQAEYSVGVYERSLFNKPLGHAVQFAAIEEMKRLGLKWYYLGPLCSEYDSYEYTDKERSIAHFKEGFATHTFLNIILYASLT